MHTMIFYHGTTKKAWKEIQEEGALWGRKDQYWCGNKMSRINWLATKKEDAGIYDEHGVTNTSCVILEIDLPEVKRHDYWEYVTYDPIPISRIRRINEKQSEEK